MLNEIQKQIKDVIVKNPNGLNILELSKKININRNAITRYIDVLVATGNLEMKNRGKSKIYYPSKRVPTQALLDYTNNAIILIDQNKMIIQKNKQFDEVFKIKKDIISKKSIEISKLFMSSKIIEELIDSAIRGEQKDKEISIIFNHEKKYFNLNALPTLFIDGSQGCTLIFEDITYKKNSEEKLMYHYKLLEQISQLTTRFISLKPNQINDSINETLKIIGSLVNVDRSYIFEFSDKKAVMNNTYEWCAKDIEPQINNLQEIPNDFLKWWIKKLEKKEDIIILDVTKMPKEAENEKNILLEQDIISLLVVPLIYKEKLIGYMGFDSVKQKKKWSKETIKLLHIISDALVNILKRKKELEK